MTSSCGSGLADGLVDARRPGGCPLRLSVKYWRNISGALTAGRDYQATATRFLTKPALPAVLGALGLGSHRLLCGEPLSRGRAVNRPCGRWGEGFEIDQPLEQRAWQPLAMGLVHRGELIGAGSGAGSGSATGSSTPLGPPELRPGGRPRTRCGGPSWRGASAPPRPRAGGLPPGERGHTTNSSPCIWSIQTCPGGGDQPGRADRRLRAGPAGDGRTSGASRGGAGPAAGERLGEADPAATAAG